MHAFVGNGLLGLSTGMTFGDNYSPQNFEPIAVARSQQATYLWNNKPEESLKKYRQYVDAMKLDPNK